MKTKLVLVWIDRDGFELTGRYRDRLKTLPETRAILQARAVTWGCDTPALKTRLLAHIETMRKDHLWVGWYALPYRDDMLPTARRQALAEFAKINPAETTSQ